MTWVAVAMDTTTTCRMSEDLLTCQQDNKIHRMLHSMQCNVALGTALLVIGVIITVVSLKDYENDNKVFLVGPVLMTVGLLGMTRAVVNHFKTREQRLSRERRRRRRREGHSQSSTSSQSQSFRQRQESESAICLGPTIADMEEISYTDEPPPYESVAAVGSRVNLALSLPSLPPYDEGLTNPGLDLAYEPYAPPPPYDEIVGDNSEPRPQLQQCPPPTATQEEGDRPHRSHRDHSRRSRLSQVPEARAPYVAVPMQLPVAIAAETIPHSQQQPPQQYSAAQTDTSASSTTITVLQAHNARCDAPPAMDQEATDETPQAHNEDRTERDPTPLVGNNHTQSDENVPPAPNHSPCLPTTTTRKSPSKAAPPPPRACYNHDYLPSASTESISEAASSSSFSLEHSLASEASSPLSSFYKPRRAYSLDSTLPPGERSLDTYSNISETQKVGSEASVTEEREVPSPLSADSHAQSSDSVTQDMTIKPSLGC